MSLAGDTMVVSRDGILPIRSLVGNPTLLVPRMGRHGGLSVRGTFQKVEVRSFGIQALWEISLQRGRSQRVVAATADQCWLIAAERWKENWKEPETYERTTQQLHRGDRLRALHANSSIQEQSLMPVAAAQGFVFGDGACGMGERPAFVNFNGTKDRALLPFFTGYQPRKVMVHSEYKGKQIAKKEALQIYGVPRFWKQLPPIQESRAFLLSWLAGYFAADGTVSKTSQAVLSSASQEALGFARAVLAVCGVGYSVIRRSMRLGKGTKLSALYRVNLRVRDLPSWFFLMPHHLERIKAAEHSTAETPWCVMDIRKTKKCEETFGVRFKSARAFGLSEDLTCGGAK